MKVKLKDYGSGDFIRIIREWTGLTQKEFAKRISKSERTIQEYEAGTTFTEADAIKEIEDTYGKLIDECLKNRDYSMPVLAIGLPFSAFGNRMVLKFVKSSDEDDIEWRFYYHYRGFCLDVLSKDNASIRRIIIKIIYDHFYESRFKKRIEGSREYHKNR